MTLSVQGASVSGVVHSKAHKALVATMVAYRVEARLTQAELAKRLKRNYKWVSAVETGARGVQAGDLPAIAKALKTTPRKFFERWLAILET
jgi:transcriptional regulator with XRE-family HTH domain